MPKESRRCGSRGSNRRSYDSSDDNKKSTLRETPKITGSVNRFAPFQRDTPRRGSKSGEEETFTTLVHSTTSNLNAKSSGIIENGMKYIMFPLHLLRFCIFGTTTLSIDDEKSKYPKRIEPSEEKSGEKRDKKVEVGGKKDAVTSSREKEKDVEKEVGKRSSDDSKKLPKDKTKPCDSKNRPDERVSRDRRDSTERGDRVGERGSRKERSRSAESRKSFGSRRADDDSDSSSSDKWSTAESSMDVSIEYGNVYETTPYRLEEPMDISIEESIDENLPGSCRNSSHRTGTSRGRIDPSPSSSSSFSASWSSEVEENSSSSSIEEEIARVFQKKCTSSSSSSTSSSSTSSTSFSSSNNRRRNEPDRKDRKDHKDVASRSSISDSKIKSAEEGIKPNARKKEESPRERTAERRTTPSTTSYGRNSSPRRVSRTPIKSKDTKKKKYKEKGVQTDSAFSDDDVEMIPLDARLTEKRICSRSYRRKPQSGSYQMERMDHDILYIADNEDSNDGCRRYSRNRISPVSESSSSTDLGFEDQRCLTPNCRSRATEKEHAKGSLHDNTTIKDRQKEVSLPRAPPGFPQVPQNPPISLKTWNDHDSRDVTFSTEMNLSILQYGQNYPPAPIPMRHLYHEYPEFMPFPEEIGPLQFFQTTPANGYLT